MTLLTLLHYEGYALPLCILGSCKSVSTHVKVTRRFHGRTDLSGKICSSVQDASVGLSTELLRHDILLFTAVSYSIVPANVLKDLKRGSQFNFLFCMFRCDAPAVDRLIKLKNTFSNHYTAGFGASGQ